MLRIRYNGEIYEYFNKFSDNDINYYSMINGKGETLILKVVGTKTIELVVLDDEERKTVEDALVKKRNRIFGLEVISYAVIENNFNIDSDYSKTITEASNMIISKFPRFKDILMEKLKTATVREIMEEEKNLDYKSYFYTNSDTLALPNLSIDRDSLIYVSVHELFHLIFNDKENRRNGFLEIDTFKGNSINEGFVEYLTRIVCSNSSVYMNGYNNDLNNLFLLSSVIDINDIINAAVDGGLKTLYQLYTKKSKNTISFHKIINNMDYEHNARVNKSGIKGDFKERYLLDFIGDYKKISYDNVWMGNMFHTSEDLEYSMSYVREIIEELTENEDGRNEIICAYSQTEKELRESLKNYNEVLVENDDKIFDAINK